MKDSPIFQSTSAKRAPRVSENFIPVSVWIRGDGKKLATRLRGSGTSLIPTISFRCGIARGINHPRSIPPSIKRRNRLSYSFAEGQADATKRVKSIGDRGRYSPWLEGNWWMINPARPSHPSNYEDECVVCSRGGCLPTPSQIILPLDMNCPSVKTLELFGERWAM